VEKELAILKNSIRKKLIKDLLFDAINDSVDFRISLSGVEYRELQKESSGFLKKYELDRLIDEVKSSIKFDARVKEELKILPAKLELGQHIRLKTHDESGEAIEGMIHIGNDRFLLVEHERNSLELLDELQSIISPWSVGGYINFLVFRDKKQIIREGEKSVYRTKKITNIQLLNPQFDFDDFYRNS
jgi:hypothetical protein